MRADVAVIHILSHAIMMMERLTPGRMPGLRNWIPTERHADDPQDLKDTYAKNIPMGRMGDHEDIGEAVAFLASEAAKFITGQKISVNDGNTFE